MNWRLLTSADVSAKYYSDEYQEYPIDVHSWFFIYDPNLNASAAGVDYATSFGMPLAPPPPAYDSVLKY